MQLDAPNDPLEPVNRVVFGFNVITDQFLFQPLAEGYHAVTPVVAQRDVSHFFSNLDEPRTIVNDLLQGQLKQAASDTGRFLLNSTAGFAGLMDVASDAGMPRHHKDFSETLGRQGIGEGWFLMLPLLGPSTNRDVVGLLADAPFQLGSYVPLRTDLSLTGGDLLDTRTHELGTEDAIENAPDPYAFVRQTYLQERAERLQPEPTRRADLAMENAP